MGLIDLHVHSNASDGTLSPSEVVTLAADTGLDAIALTDHDTIDGLKEARAAAAGLPIKIIPGIELSCVYEGTEIHILGLFVDTENEEFKKGTDELLRVREARNDEMIRRFCAAGIPITQEELTGGNPDTVITRAHFARVLVEKGIVPDLNRAFKNYLTYGGPYCVRKEAITPERAMKLLTACHAFPALAHPYQYKLGDKKTEALAVYLKELGLMGIEVYHSSNNAYESGKLRQMARRLDLLPTGGSDFHGLNKPDIRLGVGRGNLRVSSLLLDDIEERLRQKSRA